MGTLEQLLAEYNLTEPVAQTKTAAAAEPAKNEVEQVLENLGLTGANDGVTKVANSNDNKEGDRMSLTGIYEELFGEAAPAALAADGGTGTEKVANAEESNEATNLFGELTAHYFGVAQGEFLDKVATSLEAECQQDEEQPLKHLGNSSTLGNTIGKPADPHMPVNHSASGGAHMQAMTGNKSPYTLKDLAYAKQILKRVGPASAGTVGAIKD